MDGAWAPDLQSYSLSSCATPWTHVATGSDAGVAAAIRWPRINLAIWQRGLHPAVARFSRACVVSGGLDLCFDAPVDDIALTLDEKSKALPGANLHSRLAWIEDVARLARLFSEATGARDLHVDVETLRHDACRLFHVDIVRCRLITTYAGPGTQWLHDEDVDRSALGTGDNAAVRRTGGAVRRLKTGSVGLFKGERLPGMQGRGIVHRSAPVLASGRRRLVVKIEQAGEIPR